MANPNAKTLADSESSIAYQIYLEEAAQTRALKGGYQDQGMLANPLYANPRVSEPVKRKMEPLRAEAERKRKAREVKEKEEDEAEKAKETSSDNTALSQTIGRSPNETESEYTMRSPSVIHSQSSHTLGRSEERSASSRTMSPMSIAGRPSSYAGQAQSNLCKEEHEEGKEVGGKGRGEHMGCDKKTEGIGSGKKAMENVELSEDDSDYEGDLFRESYEEACRNDGGNR